MSEGPTSNVATAEIAATNGAAAADGSSAAQDQTPKWLVGLTARLDKIEGRFSEFGRDLGRLREKDKRAPSTASVVDNPVVPSDDGAAIAPKSVTHQDLGAAVKLGSVMTKLQAEAASHIQSLLDSGKSYSEALEAAELIAKYSAPSSAIEGAPAETRVSAPTAVAASAKQQTAPAYPQDMFSLVELQKTNPALFAQIMSDDHPFDPTGLPWRKR